LEAYEHVKLIIALSTMEPEIKHCPKSIVIVEKGKEKKTKKLEPILLISNLSSQLCICCMIKLITTF